MVLRRTCLKMIGVYRLKCWVSHRRFCSEPPTVIRDKEIITLCYRKPYMYFYEHGKIKILNKQISLNSFMPSTWFLRWFLWIFMNWFEYSFFFGAGMCNEHADDFYEYPWINLNIHFFLCRNANEHADDFYEYPWIDLNIHLFLNAGMPMNMQMGLLPQPPLNKVSRTHGSCRDNNTVWKLYKTTNWIAPKRTWVLRTIIASLRVFEHANDDCKHSVLTCINGHHVVYKDACTFRVKISWVLTGPNFGNRTCRHRRAVIIKCFYPGSDILYKTMCNNLTMCTRNGYSTELNMNKMGIN